MTLNRNGRTGRRRRGVILLVVLAMLTLFAIVGIAFVYVSDSQATSARVAREAETALRAEVDPEAAFAYFLGQLIYDVNDPTAGDPGAGASAVRGQSLGRNLYGWDYDPTQPTLPQVPNDRPFAGPGWLKTPAPFGAGGVAAFDAFLPNYRYFPGDRLRDPGRFPHRANPAAARGAYMGDGTPGYSYPDHNNFFLAHMDPTTGRILVPSFHREYLFGRLDQSGGNWATPEGKYLTPRPRTADNQATFPMPGDRWGDVKNLDWAPGGNDSIWVPFGAPVMRSPDGRLYTMLVAPTVLALDGRLNLNVVGNVLGNANDHRGNQGWGPHEINPRYVLNANATEWQAVLLGTPAAGAPRIVGRYGAGRVPVGPAVGGGNPPRGWAQVDFNGMKDDGSRAQSDKMLLPASGAGGVQLFPTFPATSYGNGSLASNEKVNHPLIYNALRPQGDNRLLPIYGLAPLLRLGGTGGEWLTSDLARLLPSNLLGGGSQKRRNLVTLHSMDLDRPSAQPYVWSAADTNTAYLMNGPAPGLSAPFIFPQGTNPIAFPASSQRAATPGDGEFDPATWRSLTALRQRLDLNRVLAPYPAAGTNGVIDVSVAANVTAVQKADSDRQQFALEVFDALRAVTGAPTPQAAFNAGAGLNGPSYNAVRYLAQLAVNVVDFIDNDGYSTAFNWFNDTTATPVSEWVFGAEIPRLQLNETYVQRDNYVPDLDIDMTTGLPIKVKNGGQDQIGVSVELLNPTQKDVAATGNVGLSADVVAWLNDGTVANPIYRIVLADGTVGAAGGALLDPANTTGDPDFNLGGNPSRVLAAAADWPPGLAVQPVGSAFNDPTGSVNGFCCVGPNSAYAPGANPNLPVVFKSAGLTYRVPYGDATPKARPVVLLQRLANPALPLNNVKGPGYNPYVTIDYSENRNAPQINDMRLFDLAGALATPPVITAMGAWGRTQPFAGAFAFLRRQAPNTASVGMPQNTFYRHNSVADTAATLAPGDATLTVPFNWLPHLDRALISPAELLHVCGYKPFELGQTFLNPATGAAYQHVAPWADPASRLYRFLEFAETRSMANGVMPWGRVPGRVNLNGVWNVEVFLALTDPQNGNDYDVAGATAVFKTLIAQRSTNSVAARFPSLAADATLAGALVPGPTDPALTATGWTLDRPFRGLSVGAAPGGDELGGGPRGVEDTLLRPAPQGLGSPTWQSPRTLEVTGTHPYQRLGLLSRLYNGVTTRDNVYAVWATVGFFEVNAAGQLGAEIGRSENKHVRHRMFSIVDRTQLTVMNATITGAAPLVPGQVVQLNVPPGGFQDARTGRSWLVQAGNVIVLEPNTDNEETVSLFIDPNTGALSYRVTRGHPASFPASMRGNPGPWLRFDPKKDAEVVLYFALID